MENDTLWREKKTKQVANPQSGSASYSLGTIECRLLWRTCWANLLTSCCGTKTTSTRTNLLSTSYPRPPRLCSGTTRARLKAVASNALIESIGCVIPRCRGPNGGQILRQSPKRAREFMNVKHICCCCCCFFLPPLPSLPVTKLGL